VGERPKERRHAPFTITSVSYWLNRIAGRNPLVRGTDRIQAWVIILAALITVLAIPVACAIGTSVYDARVRFYAEEAKHRHAVTATALENSTVDVGRGPADVSFFVRASWTDAGSDHIDVVKWADVATAGDQADIWVDDVTASRSTRLDHRAARPAMPLALPSRSGSP
jgi:hypothetical protein